MEDPQELNEQAMTDDRQKYEERVRTRLPKKRREFSRSLEPIKREAYRNICYYHGNQWIRWDSTHAGYRQKRLPDHIPTPVTNKFAEKANTLISALTRRPPKSSYQPRFDDPDSIATAEIAGFVQQVVNEESEIEEVRDQAAWWVALTGNAFIHSYYEVEGTYEVPDPGGAVDEYGQPVVYEVPYGRIKRDVLSLFEVLADPAIELIKDQPVLILQRLYSEDDARRLFDLTDEDLKPSRGMPTEDTGLYYLDAISHASQLSSGHMGLAASDTKGIVVFEYYERPNKEFQKGVHGIMVGHKVVHAGPIEYEQWNGRFMEKFVAVRHLTFDKLTKRFLAKSRLSDLISLQDERNQLQSMFQLASRRMSNPVWLAPQGCDVGTFVGEPGAVIRYRALLLAGQAPLKPERIPGQNPPQFIVVRFDQIDKEMEEIVGRYIDNPPTGVTAASALAYMGERTEENISTFRRAWERGWAGVDQDGIAIFKQFADEDRLLAIGGRNKQYEVKRFNAASLKGHVKVQWEQGSSQPVSSAARRASAELLAKLGAVDLSSPKARMELLRMFSMPELQPETDDDVRRATLENELFIHYGQIPLHLAGIDHDEVHLDEHMKLVKSQEFMEMLRGEDPELAEWALGFLHHVQGEHLAYLQNQAAAAAGPRPPPPRRPGAPPPTPPGLPGPAGPPPLEENLIPKEPINREPLSFSPAVMEQVA